MSLAKIFISYAKEDQEKALWLYDNLKRAGLSPWIDERDILVGERWEQAIHRAIKSSDIILVLLSSNSVAKRGYVQKEIKTALKFWEDKLEEDIYLIPVRLDECKPPDQLSGFQWANLWEYDGFRRLLKSIDSAIKSKQQYELEKNRAGQRIESLGFLEESEKPARYYACVKFPRFHEPGKTQEIERVNAIIAKWASNVFENFLEEEKRIIPDTPVIEGEAGKSVIEVSWNVTLWNKDVISVRQDIYWYGAGAAHGNRDYQHFNFNLAPFHDIELHGLFDSNSDWRKFIQDWCVHNLTEQLIKDGDEIENSRLEWIRTGVNAIDAVGFNLREDSLVLQWSPYEVGPYAWGPRHVLIPYKVLRTIIQSSGVIDRLIGAS